LVVSIKPQAMPYAPHGGRAMVLPARVISVDSVNSLLPAAAYFLLT
jgi:hypothetical protein